MEGAGRDLAVLHEGLLDDRAWMGELRRNGLFTGALPQMNSETLTASDERFPSVTTALTHAHDDAVRTGLVVEHDRVGLRAAAVELGDDADRLLQLATVRRRAHAELHGVLAHHQRHLAVALDMNLFEGRAMGERAVVVAPWLLPDRT